DMIPDNYGTNVTLYPGDTAFVDLNFVFDPSWVPANCEVICFVQNDSLTSDSIKEVMQGAKTVLVANAVEETPISFDPVLSIKYTGDRNIKIDYSLTHPSRVGIEIADVSGRILFSENFGLQDAGHNVIFIKPADLNFSPGALFLIFKTDYYRKAEKITVF
ncbi:hypothetical protein JW890_00590, partial [candidate division WOR-3 bacterium]|nr:hypothetical protein [candidate division WOR-3 bacterium]